MALRMCDRAKRLDQAEARVLPWIKSWLIRLARVVEAFVSNAYSIRSLTQAPLQRLTRKMNASQNRTRAAETNNLPVTLHLSFRAKSRNL